MNDDEKITAFRDLIESEKKKRRVSHNVFNVMST